MRKLSIFRWLWWGLAAAAAPAGGAAAFSDPAQLVNPLIGTAASYAKDPVPGGSGGSVFPGAAVPFGMVQFSPDTPHGEPSGYGYADHAITGFSLTHFDGAGCANNAELPILPTTGAGTISKAIEFSHADETAAPGYYGVTLANGVKSELTATARTGFGRFVFPGDGLASNLLFDVSRTATGRRAAQFAISGNETVVGSIPSGNFCGTGNKYTLYFVATFDHPFTVEKTWDGGALLNFGSRAHQAVQVKVGLSYTSIAGARDNLLAESPRWSFAEVRSRARELWNEHLGRIIVKGGTPEQLTKFYTALYHSLLQPNVFSDVNGDFIGFDNQVHRSDDHVQYANFSGWDIYRSEIPLLAWLFPRQASDMMQSLVIDADHCGALPKWSHNNTETGVMIGDPAAPIIASAYAFGARRFDAKRALAYMVKTGTYPDAACNGFLSRPGLKEYLAHGFIPEGTEHVWGSVSTSLEYQTADFAVAQLASALRADDVARAFAPRVRFWRRNFDADIGLLRPLLASGEWRPDRDFGAASTSGFVEGSAGQYLWANAQDPLTLKDKLGGKEQAISRLDQFFTKLNSGIAAATFYAGNEPGFVSPWLYPWLGVPARTADVVRRIMDETFTAGPDGLPGNDDLGAMSSWYVWSALGMFPALPGVGGVVLSTPTFAHTTIYLENGRVLELSAPGAPEARYVRRLHIGARQHRRAWVASETLQAGGVFDYHLGSKPSAWGMSELPPVLVDPE